MSEQLSIYDFEVLQDDSDEKEIVSELITKFDELHHINSNSVFVVKNHKKKANEDKMTRGEGTYASISKLSPKYTDILEQLSGNHYAYILEIVSSEFDQIDENQQKAVIYFELASIDEEYNVRTDSADNWLKIINVIGVGFKRLDQSCTDILSDNFKWSTS
jgi:predicted metallopeptidase